MTDLLRRMEEASRARVEAARARRPGRELRRRVLDAPPAESLRLDPSGFDLIAEIKLRSPSAGRLSDPGADPLRLVRERALAYAAGGAAAVSVLTEPSAFDGDLFHLLAASRAVTVPVMRKDFLVDPYQLLEARAAGASGVLLIAKLLRGSRFRRMIDACLELGMFALIEVFDAPDVDRAAAALAPEEARNGPPVLLGVNARDLRSLALHGDSLERLAMRLPSGYPKVAESGLADEEDAARVASLGYSLALVGTALMASGRPQSKTAALIRSGRTARRRRAAGGD